MSSLYDLTGQLLQLEEMIDAGEYDDDILLDTWESIDAVFEDKADGYAKVIANMNATVDAIKVEEKRLADRRRTIENGIKRLKDNLQYAMIQADKPKFKTQLFSFNIQKNPAKVVIDDEAELDDAYITQTVTFSPNKEFIKDALKAGKDVRGAHLEQGESLRIR